MKFIKWLPLPLVCACLAAIAGHAASDDGMNLRSAEALRLASPPGQFSPSNARTADGKLIPADQFFPAARCMKCHNDTHTAWSESLHRNSVRAPLYKESVEILERTRGTEAMMHCESCHSPVAVFSGALLKENNKPDRGWRYLLGVSLDY